MEGHTKGPMDQYCSGYTFVSAPVSLGLDFGFFTWELLYYNIPLRGQDPAPQGHRRSRLTGTDADRNAEEAPWGAHWGPLALGPCQRAQIGLRTRGPKGKPIGPHGESTGPKAPL